MAAESNEKTASDAENIGWDGFAGYAFADDGLYDSSSVSGQAIDYITWEKFEIPYQAKIMGLEILLNAFREPQCNPISPSLSVSVSADGGTSFSIAKNTSNLTGTEATYTLGSSGDKWQLLNIFGGNKDIAWTPEIFNNQSSFKVRITSGWKPPEACQVGYSMAEFLDYIRAKVYYKMPDSPRIFSTMIGMRPAQ